MNYVLFEVDRLDHAIMADTKHPIPILVERRVGHQHEGKHWEETVYDQKGWFSTHTLEKLRSKAIYAIRSELAEIGELDLADKMIFPRRDGEDCEGR